MVSELNEDQLPPPGYESSPGSAKSERVRSVDDEQSMGSTHHGLASLKAQPGSHHHFSDVEVRKPQVLFLTVTI